MGRALETFKGGGGAMSNNASVAYVIVYTCQVPRRGNSASVALNRPTLKVQLLWLIGSSCCAINTENGKQALTASLHRS